LDWSGAAGKATAALVNWIMERREKPAPSSASSPAMFAILSPCPVAITRRGAGGS
jgi:hypothetical protein